MITHKQIIRVIKVNSCLIQNHEEQEGEKHWLRQVKLEPLKLLELDIVPNGIPTVPGCEAWIEPE